MSAVRSVLARAEAAGLQLKVEGSGLRLRGPARPPADLLADIQTMKPALVALLTAEDPAVVEIPADPCPSCGWACWWQPNLADPWRCDVCAPHPGDWPGAGKVVDLNEREAIQSEPSLPPIGTAARARADEKHAATVAGLLMVAKRQPSWWDAAAHDPPAGAVCSCCSGRAWWSRDRCGWCCSTCHPPLGETNPKKLFRVTTEGAK